MHDGFRTPSDAGPAVSVQFRTLSVTQVVLNSLTLLEGARSSRLNRASDTKQFCCIRYGNNEERILDVIPKRDGALLYVIKE